MTQEQIDYEAARDQAIAKEIDNIKLRLETLEGNVQTPAVLAQGLTSSSASDNTVTITDPGVTSDLTTVTSGSSTEGPNTAE